MEQTTKRKTKAALYSRDAVDCGGGNGEDGVEQGATVGAQLRTSWNSGGMIVATTGVVLCKAKPSVSGLSDNEFRKGASRELRVWRTGGGSGSEGTGFEENPRAATRHARRSLGEIRVCILGQGQRSVRLLARSTQALQGASESRGPPSSCQCWSDMKTQ